MMSGIGTYNYIKGPIYEGHFNKNKPDGEGVETWPDGSIYEGRFKAGKKHGKGYYKWHQGCTYTGEWLDNMIHGVGKYEWPDGRVLFVSYKSAILDNGSRIKCMVEANTFGKTRNVTMESTKMIKNAVSEFFIGQMENNTRVIGRMAISMEKD